MYGMMLMYAEYRNEMYMEAGSLLLNYLDSIIVDKEKITFIHKLKAILFAELALIAATFEKYDDAERYITDASRYALKFDAAPNYSPQDMKFLKDEELPSLLLDGLGETAIQAIENFVFKKAEPGEALDYIKNKFERLKNE